MNKNELGVFGEFRKFPMNGGIMVNGNASWNLPHPPLEEEG